MVANKRQLMASEIDAIVEKLDNYLQTLKEEWNALPLLPSSWWKLNKVRLESGTRFMIGCLDRLVFFVEGLIPAGTDKKAAVMALLNKLFDYVITPCLPIWLRPLTPVIKDIMINVVISSMIDYVVAKYNEGIWKKDVNNATFKATYYLPQICQ